MEIISSASEMQLHAEQARMQGKRIGLVPTMGYLHEGHLSLIALAKKSCETVVTSIFVNPTQFGPGEDFDRYPRDIERDKALCAAAGTTMLFTPEAKEIFPDGYATYISVDGLSTVLEGKFRPTHFRGVTTVVAKLLHLTKPHKAFFGQKDAQQCIIVRKMVRDLCFDTEIRVAPIVREKDGLAMSSRNVYLSPEERSDALILSASLRQAEQMAKGGQRRAADIISAIKKLIEEKRTAAIDYVAVVNAETLAPLEMIEQGIPSLIALAVRFGSTRLIDNTIITVE
ncbi:MAG TPA: pantoate--beta-alanine ligase [Bacteroidota bacterium]|nr:pantoate--beta-alanine ligase [Bacteroidota bacterium]